MDRFARAQPLTYKPDILRITMIMLLVAASGVIWHFVRPAAIRLAARKSLGLAPRTALIRDALNGIYDALPELPGEQYPHSFWKPSPGCATWPLDPVMRYVGGRRAFAPARHVFVDGQLEPHGSVKAEFPFISAPYADRNGRLVAAYRYNAATERTRLVNGICIIRLGADANEIVGIVAYDARPKPAIIRGIHCGWRDEDGNGSLEFILLNEKVVMQPSGVTAQTLAVFAWDADETALRAVSVPSDGSLVFWTPPDGRPYEFPQSAVIDDICRELLPLPDGFGLQGSSPPAAQQSQPAP